jgi:hypothetical protein
MRSVLGRDELEARAVGISARKGGNDNPRLNVCQVVNNKAFVSSEMRKVRSNHERIVVVRARGSNAELLRESFRTRGTSRLALLVQGNVPCVTTRLSSPSIISRPRICRRTALQLVRGTSAMASGPLRLRQKILEKQKLHCGGRLPFAGTDRFPVHSWATNVHHARKQSQGLRVGLEPCR